MIEPDRILEGLARTLEQSVLPELASGFARGQLFAVLEVIGALQGQVSWGGMLLENEAASLAALLGQAAQRVDGDLGQRLADYASIASAPLADRLREGRALVCALIEAGHADGGELGAEIDSFLANDTIFKAMALRPGRLAEISQG
jgi:hypothetical protein